MKIIDILNKINNNEEVPEKIKFDDTVFEYDKEQKEYNHRKDDGFYETLLYRVMTTHFIDVLLEAEVEVIEENKRIEELSWAVYLELKKGHYNIENILNGIREDLKEHRDKINELVRAVNKINKEREEK